MTRQALINLMASLMPEMYGGYEAGAPLFVLWYVGQFYKFISPKTLMEDKLFASFLRHGIDAVDEAGYLLAFAQLRDECLAHKWPEWPTYADWFKHGIRLGRESAKLTKEREQQADQLFRSCFETKSLMAEK